MVVKTPLPENINLPQETSEDNYKAAKNPIFNFFVQFAVVAVIFFALGFTLGQKQIEIKRRGIVPQFTVINKDASKNQDIDFSLFWDVFETLPDKYIDKSAVDGQKFLYGAISGMVRSLGDPYTAFLDPKQNEAVRDELSGSYEGIGIQIGFNKDKRLVVIAPISGTPADGAGISAKDLILKIDSRDTFDLTLPEAVDLIRGPAGTKVKLQLSQEGTDKPFDVVIARAQINIKSVEVDWRNTDRGEVAIVKVTRFGEKTNSEWDMAVSEIAQRDIFGIIVDMRNNPGGLLDSSIHVASEFMKGTIVKEQFSDGRIASRAQDHEGRFLKMPLVVLVNSGSASASEIFAGAIKDARRAKIVGEKTFGKGTVQEPIELSGGSALHVTVAKWLTPAGKSINGDGIMPDVAVETTSGDKEQNKDPQLEKALELI